jgi:hypothetical protein
MVRELKNQCILRALKLVNVVGFWATSLCMRVMQDALPGLVH